MHTVAHSGLRRFMAPLFGRSVSPVDPTCTCRCRQTCACFFLKLFLYLSKEKRQKLCCDCLPVYFIALSTCHPRKWAFWELSSLWGAFWLLRGCQNHRGAPQLFGGGWLSSNFCSGQCGFADCQLDSVGPPDSYFVSWLFLSFGSGQILLALDSLQNPRQWIKVQCENSWLSKMLILHVKLAGDPTRRSWRTSFLHQPQQSAPSNRFEGYLSSK